MKMELPVQAPDWVRESWEGQFKVFPWYYFAVDLPTPILLSPHSKRMALQMHS